MLNKFKSQAIRNRLKSEQGASLIEMILITAGIVVLIAFLWRQFGPAVEGSTSDTVDLINDGHNIVGNR